MRKSVIILALISTFFLNQISGINSENNTNRNVLVLFALTPTTPAYRFILDGIRDKLTEAYGTSYTLHTEYLETEQYPKGNYPKEKFDLYNQKYEDIKIDLLICVGVDIISTIKKNGASYLINLPAITIDLDLSKYGLSFDLSLNGQTAVIGLKLDPGKTISEALEIFPKTSSIYFICGVSDIDRIYTQISKEEAKKIDRHIIVSFITDRSMDEVINLTRSLSANSLIIVPGFNIDSKQVRYFNPEAVRLISRSANAPVFTYSDMGFGDGSFGGKILSFRKVGLLGGETAVKILNGVDPDSIRISDNDYYDYLLDWRELIRWNLKNLAKGKDGRTVMYRTPSFLGTYKWFLITGILFLVLQTYLIAMLIRMNIRQKKMTKQLIETDRRYMDIIREDRILRMGMLTVSLSHELNQPLTAILSTAQAGKRFLDSNNSNTELLNEIFNNIVDADNRAASILKSIRGLMKLEKREKEKVDLNNLILEISDLYRSKAIELNSKLNLQLTDNQVFIFADAIQIQQVILNFISNAAQSIEKTGNNSNIITITETIDDEYVTLSVRDFGNGIDEAVKDKLFEPFVTSRKDGTGVGLAISRFIIEDHQGKIWAENKPDGGAEFSFKLKVINDPAS
jgi:signal transduction histidine kinase